MSGFPIVDLVVGMIFIYFLLSVICSSAIEIVITLMGARAKVLAEWAESIFNEKISTQGGQQVTLGQSILDHCAVTVLSTAGKAPSYVDAKNFTSALIEKITYDPQHPNSIAKDIDDVILALENTSLLSTEIKRSFLGFANDVKNAPEVVKYQTANALELFRLRVESWYDSSMDRLTGTLKRRYISICTFLVATVATVAMNADSMAIAKYLYSNPEARAKLAATAYAAATDSSYLNNIKTVRVSRSDSLTLDSLKKNISLSLQNIREAEASLAGEVPLGWGGWNPKGITAATIFAKFTGLLVTILAIFMGAPFWFDLLNKIANLRGTGPKPPSSTTAAKA